MCVCVCVHAMFGNVVYLQLIFFLVCHFWKCYLLKIVIDFFLLCVSLLEMSFTADC